MEHSARGGNAMTPTEPEQSGEKSLLEIFCLGLKTEFGHEYGKIENMTKDDREPMERVLEAVAAHARRTDQVKAQMEAALRNCKSGLIQLADKSVHWYVTEAEKALAAAEAERKSGNE